MLIAESALGAGDGGSILIKNGLDDWINQGVEEVRFDNGTVWTLADLRTKLLQQWSTSGNDTIVGFASDDTIRALGGDDVINGQSGNDTYVYARGDGNDTITENPNAGTSDKLVLNGILPSQVSLSRSGNDVTLLIAESTSGAGDAGSIVLKNELDDWINQGVEQIRFDNGTVWTLADLRTKLLQQSSTSGNDTILGFVSDDTIQGLGGDDAINGQGGNDTYIYVRGDGNDTITESPNSGWLDKLVLNGVDPSQVSLSRSGNDVTLLIAESASGAGDSGSILLKNELDDFINQGVEQIRFDNGTVWTLPNLRSILLSQASTSGNDTIVGFSGNDTITGGQGNDLLTGAGGNDTFVFGPSFGSDRITDFSAGAGVGDVIEIDATLFADFAAILAGSSQVGSDTVITFDASNKITLQNVVMSNLVADDFRFV